MATVPKTNLNKTKEALISHAMELFAQKGYEGTSIREIIEKTGVTRPMVYYYFKNKEDLFCQLVESLFAESEKNLIRIYNSNTTCRERLSTMIHGSFEKAQEQPVGVRFLMRYYMAPPDSEMRVDKEIFVQKRLELVTRIMAEGIENGELSGYEPSSLATLFLSLMDMQILSMARKMEHRLTKDLADEIIEFFFKGANTLGATSKKGNVNS
jgi:AcrR family transcriptional regulator